MRGEGVSQEKLQEKALACAHRSVFPDGMSPVLSPNLLLCQCPPQAVPRSSGSGGICGHSWAPARGSLQLHERWATSPAHLATHQKPIWVFSKDISLPRGVLNPFFEPLLVGLEGVQAARKTKQCRTSNPRFTGVSGRAQHVLLLPEIPSLPPLPCCFAARWNGADHLLRWCKTPWPWALCSLRKEQSRKVKKGICVCNYQRLQPTLSVCIKNTTYLQTKVTKSKRVFKLCLFIMVSLWAEVFVVWNPHYHNSLGVSDPLSEASYLLQK